MRGGDLRSWLRVETSALHDRLDHGMSGLDFSTRDGLTDFLLSHVYGLQAVLDDARHFAVHGLGVMMPDYLVLAQADLRAMGHRARDEAGERRPSDGPGACYVILGSRLGMGVLRQRGYWRGGDFQHSLYMEDRSEKHVWAALLDWLGDQSGDAGAHGAVLAGAQRAFAAFERGLSLAREDRYQESLTP